MLKCFVSDTRYNLFCFLKIMLLIVTYNVESNNTEKN